MRLLAIFRSNSGLRVSDQLDCGNSAGRTDVRMDRSGNENRLVAREIPSNTFADYDGFHALELGALIRVNPAAVGPKNALKIVGGVSLRNVLG